MQAEPPTNEFPHLNNYCDRQLAMHTGVCIVKIEPLFTANGVVHYYAHHYFYKILVIIKHASRWECVKRTQWREDQYVQI